MDAGDLGESRQAVRLSVAGAGIRLPGLVLRLYYDLWRYFLLQLKPEESVYRPLFATWEREKGKSYASGEEWCAGFYFGFCLKNEAWEPLCNDEDYMDLLQPIFWFFDEDIRKETAPGGTRRSCVRRCWARLLSRLGASMSTGRRGKRRPGSDLWLDSIGSWRRAYRAIGVEPPPMPGTKSRRAPNRSSGRRSGRSS